MCCGAQNYVIADANANANANADAHAHANGNGVCQWSVSVYVSVFLFALSTRARWTAALNHKRHQPLPSSNVFVETARARRSLARKSGRAWMGIGSTGLAEPGWMLRRGASAGSAWRRRGRARLLAQAFQCPLEILPIQPCSVGIPTFALSLRF